MDHGTKSLKSIPEPGRGTKKLPVNSQHRLLRNENVEKKDCLSLTVPSSLPRLLSIRQCSDHQHTAGLKWWNRNISLLYIQDGQAYDVVLILFFNTTGSDSYLKIWTLVSALVLCSAQVPCFCSKVSLVSLARLSLSIGFLLMVFSGQVTFTS